MTDRNYPFRDKAGMTHQDWQDWWTEYLCTRRWAIEKLKLHVWPSVPLQDLEAIDGRAEA